MRAALRASEAGQLLVSALTTHPLPSGLLNVVAAGKAARPMLDAVMRTNGDRVRHVAIGSGGHPLPNDASVDAGRRALAVAAGARSRGEWLVVLLSGGASAMLEVPADGLTIQDVSAATDLLISSGLPIAAMNAVRKHLSRIKGGALGAAAERVVTYALSDVHSPIEDDPSVIGSGPTVGDASTFQDALRAIEDAGLAASIPACARDRLAAGARGEHAETPKPGDPRLAASHYVVAGNRRTVTDAAAVEARARGYAVITDERPVVGEARHAAESFVHLAKGQRRSVAIIGGGETTVTLPASGAPPGGRNQEFALAAAPGLVALAPAVLVSAGTDGIDGRTDAAGAFADDTTVRRAEAAGLDLRAALREHASYEFFARLDDLLMTGPTGTNLGDLHVLLLGDSVP